MARPARLLAGLLFCAGLGAAVIVFGRPAQAALADAAEFTLDNGLQVVVLPFPAEATVSETIIYRAGAADAPPGKSGIADLLVNLAFQNTGNGAARRSNGVRRPASESDYAGTNYDFTFFFHSGPKAELSNFLALDAGRMIALPIDDENVQRERELLLLERHMKIERLPANQFNEMMNAALYLNHPYRRPRLGWRHEIETYTAQDAIDFYRSFYVPNNALLLIAGNVTADEVKVLAVPYFGPIPRGKVPPRNRLQEPQSYAPRRISLKSQYADGFFIRRDYQAPSYHTAQGNTVYALLVLAELNNPVDGRLVRQLVSRHLVVGYVSCHYQPLGYDYGTVSIAGIGLQNPGTSIEDVERAIDDEVADLGSVRITDEELAHAKKMLLQVSGSLNLDGMQHAVRIAQRMALGETLGDILAWPARVAAVSQQDVLDAARTVLVPDNSVTGVMLADPDAGVGGRLSAPPLSPMKWSFY